MDVTYHASSYDGFQLLKRFKELQHRITFLLDTLASKPSTGQSLPHSYVSNLPFSAPDAILKKDIKAYRWSFGNYYKCVFTGLAHMYTSGFQASEN